MTHKILLFTTEGESREDGNVYYAHCLLASSDTLLFNEPVFSGKIITTQTIEGIGEEHDPETVDQNKLIAYIEGLGYTVEDPGSFILTTARP